MLLRKLELGKPDAKARTVPVVLSTETPCMRAGYLEILDHGPSGVDLSRAPLPLIEQHDVSKLNIGVIEDLRVTADRKLRGVARFGTSARAAEVFGDVVAGIVRGVSIGYEHLDEGVRVENATTPTYRFRFRPFECSAVAVPADVNAGFNRQHPRGNIMDDNDLDAGTAPADEQQPQTRSARRAVQRSSEDERNRCADIAAIGVQFGLQREAATAIERGTTLDQFRATTMQRISTQPMASIAGASGGGIGLNDREVQRFSFARAILAQADPAKYGSKAGFERECSDAVAQQIGRDPRGLFVPSDVMQNRHQRDLTVGTATAGGHLVQTDVLAQSFIDLLRAATMVIKLGATVLTGLVGHVAIPRKTSGVTGAWVAEGAAATEGAVAFDQVAMSPKSCSGWLDFTRKLLLQSSLGVEELVRNELATAIALAIDRAAIQGSGSGAEPRGILNTSGIGDVAGGTNGLAPAWAHIVELESDVANVNAAVGRPGYLSNTMVRGKLKTVQAAANLPFIWPGTGLQVDGLERLNGYPTAVSSNVPSNLTKGSSSGVCSAIIFGNFADLIIGMWGILDILVDPYTASTTGTVRVVAFQDVDIAIKRAESFSAMKDALTT